ncbi:DExH-box ATP-dependent RNA helicase DExH8-like [Rutidosis leptorrhynchoides]|uniref:DExH-box ATP-dependent RNA helicase DExH8-like n=1 Tax=Rutidosis leptorrhynchoides TaxID=125765 RepID=UPI003A9980A0
METCFDPLPFEMLLTKLYNYLNLPEHVCSTSSSSSSSRMTVPSSSPSENFKNLPIMSLRSKIVEKIMENRVTLIVGETGCGKRSQVPQFLLEDNIHPILCTQPRRFAVVAVAKMVAKARNCVTGDEVGYHIGHSRVMSTRSKIIFKTAGVLLEEMREKGINALKYKVIILDEVHERSVESDLVLVCVKQFLTKNSGLRLVLMSATADITRYKEYFGDLGRDERVEVLGIPSSSQHTLYQRRVSYLDQVVEVLEMSSELTSLKYCSGSSPCDSEANMNEEVHKLIHNLVMHIHKKEPDMEKSILIFLPTYYALEQQWTILSRYSSDFKIHILHSSIDTVQALSAMRIWKSHRKVILATNIAESSITIPKVAYVIDSCRSLQVYWDAKRKSDFSEIVWVSESQAEQRRGRTGRTCDGEVYRLVTESFFGQFEKYEAPSILKLSLRQQVLLTTCAESRLINDPKVLLQKVMDPPRSEVVDDALELLVHIHALEKASPRGRYEPTFYGRLLSSFSLSFDASMLILKFGEAGMLREGIILGILMDTQPLPITHPFGREAMFTKFISDYYTQDGKLAGSICKKEVIFMANFCAFQFWQRAFQDKLRLEWLTHVLKFDEMPNVQLSSPKIEEEWCMFHNLVQSSLQHIADIYENVINSVHRYRPNFLSSSNGLPAYYEPYEFQHTCHLTVEHDEGSDTLAADYDISNPVTETKKCIALPFVDDNVFRNVDVAFRLVNLIKEIRMCYMDDVSGKQQNPDLYGGVEICRYFVSGTCNKGSECLYSHSFDAKRPVCKFFLSMKGCRNGNECFFSHSSDQLSVPKNNTVLCMEEDASADASLLLSLFPAPDDGCVLIFDDYDQQFSKHFASFYKPSSIICTTPAIQSSNGTYMEDLKIVWGLSHPHGTIISKAADNAIPWRKVKSFIWIPQFNNDVENREEQAGLIKMFFDYLAIRLLGDALYETQVIIVMNNLRFAQLQVESVAKESFFYLGQSFAFDEYTFGKLYDEFTTNKPKVVSKSIVYAFNLHPPTDIQFGDYTSVLHKQLHIIT